MGKTTGSKRSGKYVIRVEKTSERSYAKSLFYIISNLFT